MSCNESLQVQAYFDGELDASAAMQTEEHLENCVDCAALLADLEATRELIRRESPYYRASPTLREGIQEMLDREEGAVAPLQRYLRPPKHFLSGAASGAGAMALAAALAVFLYLPQSDPLMGDMMNAHLRSLMSDHLIDVASSDRHTVKPWFAGHTDVSPPAADFSKEGYKLVGGRADYVDGHRAAVVVYRHGAHIINIFAWAAGTEKLSNEETQKGYHIACWRSADLDYCAVSDTGMDELLDLVRLMKQQ
jgi:anti-sigma factor RsiW